MTMINRNLVRSCREYVKCALLSAGYGSELDIREGKPGLIGVAAALEYLNDNGLVMSGELAAGHASGVTSALDVTDNWLHSIERPLDDGEWNCALEISHSVRKVLPPSDPQDNHRQTTI